MFSPLPNSCCMADSCTNQNFISCPASESFQGHIRKIECVWLWKTEAISFTLCTLCQITSKHVAYVRRWEGLGGLWITRSRTGMSYPSKLSVYPRRSSLSVWLPGHEGRLSLCFLLFKRLILKHSAPGFPPQETFHIWHHWTAIIALSGLSWFLFVFFYI